MLKAPFPYFGGKSRIAQTVWELFGEIDNYVEPFFGSGAVLLQAPWPTKRIETVNDADGMVSNFWRAIQADPDATARYADWPVNENDLHARHYWLVQQKESLQARLEGDPDYYDPQIAGWWVWGMAAWIGHGFCSGNGPWTVVDKIMVNTGTNGTGVKHKRPHLGNAGQGVTRKLPHLGDAGKGVNRNLPHLGNAGKGVTTLDNIKEYFRLLSDRFRRTRVCCGDWSRVCGPTPTIKQGVTGVFLDPPYSAEARRDMDLYSVDCGQVAHAVREWAIEWGADSRMRIVLCGYEGEHDMPDDWHVVAWSAAGGYGGQGDGKGRENKHRERLWMSPHCQSRHGLLDLIPAEGA